MEFIKFLYLYVRMKLNLNYEGELVKSKQKSTVPFCFSHKVKNKQTTILNNNVFQKWKKSKFRNDIVRFFLPNHSSSNQVAEAV